MATFNIVLDKRNKKKNNTYNLSVRVINGKDVIYVSIAPMTVMQFNHVFIKKAVDEKSIEFREKCNEFLTKCERIYAELKPFNSKLFRQKVKEKEKDKIPLDGKISDLFDQYIQVRDLKSKTKSHYQTTSNILMTYKNGLTIYDITTKFLKQFEKKYMKNNISLATIGSYLRNLRSVINFAMDTEGLIHSSY